MANRLDDLWRQMGDTFGELPFGLSAMITAIQDTAHAEGVAEGAEKEAAKIVHCKDCKCGRPMPNPTQADLRARRCTVWHCTVLADGFCYAGDRVPASVLAPIKESKK